MKKTYDSYSYDLLLFTCYADHWDAQHHIIANFGSLKQTRLLKYNL